MSGILINLNFQSKLLEECACDLTLGCKLRHGSSIKFLKNGGVGEVVVLLLKLLI